jgi:glycosyltransferase involved in cell wall biosynthesis
LPYRVKRNFIFQRSIKRAAIKTTVSAYSRDRIHYHFNIPKDQVHILSNGVSNDFNNQDTKEDARAFISKKYGVSNYILYVSRVEPRKNHDFLLREFLAMKLYLQDISLVFIGKRSINVVQLDETIHQLTIEQRNHFFHFEQVIPTDLEAFYQACRFFVYPSMAEGFGIPPLEAAACNAPVLCSNATAMHDFNFFAPYIFDPGNKKEFHEKMRSMIESPPTEDHLKKIAADVRARYAWQKSSERFYSLLQTNATP